MSNLILPWRNWYHCMGNTYGTWLPGDHKGFRTRHHCEHVEGDYKFPPPPGYYDDLLRRSNGLLQRDAAVIPCELRPTVCELLASALRHYHVEVVELSVGGVHWHGLIRFVPVGVDPYQHLKNIGVKLTHERRLPRPGGRGLSAYDHDPVPRRVLGLARSYVTHQLKELGYFTECQGGLWALRPKCEPTSCRGHQVATARYIFRHAEQSSAVLSIIEREKKRREEDESPPAPAGGAE